MATISRESFSLRPAAAIAATTWRGKGDSKAADGAAVEAYRLFLMRFHSMVGLPSEKVSEMTLLCCGLESL